MWSTSDQCIEAVASAQFGVFSRAQAVGAGMTTAEIRRRVDRGAWRRVAPGVYSFPGFAKSHRRSCWIAVLHAGPGSLLSHGAAGLLQKLEPIEFEPVELIVARGNTRPLPGTVRHRPRSGAPPSTESIDGLVVTSVERTIVDLASQMLLPRLTTLVEHAHLEGICPITAVAVELGGVRRQGVRGVGRLETALDRLGPGSSMPHSELERLGDEVRRLAGLPEPVHEHPLPSANGRPGFVDRAWPEAMLIVEYDGRRWHTRRAQFALDRQRDLEVSALGWLPLRLMWEQFRHDRSSTASLWEATYERRLELVSGTGRSTR